MNPLGLRPGSFSKRMKIKWPMLLAHAGILLAIAGLAVGWVAPANADTLTITLPAPEVRLPGAEEVLQGVNSSRASIGHPALVLDPILMGYAQAGADLDANSLPGQEGGAVSNVIALGYGYPETIETIFCTYNATKLSLDTPDLANAAGFGGVGERLVNNVFYRHAGFGIARGVGEWEGYVMMHMIACYTADKLYKPGQTPAPGQPTAPPVSQVIYPVVTALPQSDGRLLHEVRAGQSLWAIAMAYNTHVGDILTLNRLPADTGTIYAGQKLLIPTVVGGRIVASTPTPGENAQGAPGAAVENTAEPTRTENPPAALEKGYGSNFTRSAILWVAVAGCLALLLVTLLKKEG